MVLVGVERVSSGQAEMCVPGRARTPSPGPPALQHSVQEGLERVRGYWGTALLLWGSQSRAVPRWRVLGHGCARVGGPEARLCWCGVCSRTHLCWLGLGSSRAGAESSQFSTAQELVGRWGGDAPQACAAGPGARRGVLPRREVGNWECERILDAFAELDNNVPSELHPKHAAKLKKFFSPLI